MDDGFLAVPMISLVQSRWNADSSCCCYRPCLSGPRSFLDRAGDDSVQLLQKEMLGQGLNGMRARGTVDENYL
jgi:hypothetical protein